MGKDKIEEKISSLALNIGLGPIDWKNIKGKEWDDLRADEKMLRLIVDSAQKWETSTPIERQKMRIAEIERTLEWAKTGLKWLLEHPDCREYTPDAQGVEPHIFDSK